MSESSDTPVTFSREEVQLIRDMMGTQGSQVACPCCGEPLAVEGPIASGGSQGSVYEVKCDPCHRAAIITEVPGTRRPLPESKPAGRFLFHSSSFNGIKTSPVMAAGLTKHVWKIEELLEMMESTHTPE